jgi:predicted signal transduction protein with EAL and GGDEF domain
MPEDEPLSFSMGVAAWDPAITEDELLRRADEALYRAKAAGRSRMEVAEPVGAAPADAAASTSSYGMPGLAP